MFLKQDTLNTNPFWKYLLGSFIVIIFSILGQLPLSLFITADAISEAGGDPMIALRNLDKNLQLFLILIPFVFGFLGLYLVIKKLHNRNFVSITTSRSKVDWRRIIHSFILWGSITITFISADFFINSEDYQINFKFEKFFILLIIGFILIPIQTSLEELLFRGYLFQGFSLYFKRPWIGLFLTSFIFGCLHIFNPEVQKLGLGILIYYIGTGLFLGIITLMDQGIELALGFHAANNLITALLVTSSWTAFQTESILIDISDPSLVGETIISMLILYPLFYIYMYKKYKWSDLKNKLLVKI
ncbi:MAG: CPBP family intramembrane metalloprotease domain-containing protein [Flavobacteriaceae bacterium]|nr:CPBP family intramembrane metalloprotease domain-containing protein [Flavobacteriaceae bacterium]|tara:strand:+ start:861 stop:1763 length:903 start_codon:yes stop_codon:yes gene_type:complete